MITCTNFVKLDCMFLYGWISWMMKYNGCSKLGFFLSFGEEGSAGEKRMEVIHHVYYIYTYRSSQTCYILYIVKLWKKCDPSTFIIALLLHQVYHENMQRILEGTDVTWHQMIKYSCLPILKTMSTTNFCCLLPRTKSWLVEGSVCSESAMMFSKSSLSFRLFTWLRLVLSLDPLSFPSLFIFRS